MPMSDYKKKEKIEAMAAEIGEATAEWHQQIETSNAEIGEAKERLWQKLEEAAASTTMPITDMERITGIRWHLIAERVSDIRAETKKARAA